MKVLTMIKLIITISLILSSLYIFNTNHEKNCANNYSLDQADSMLLKDTDSCIIQYWDNIYARNIVLAYKNDAKLIISVEDNPKLHITIKSTRTILSMVKYLNILYIEKSEKKIITVSKFNGVVTDYPVITVKCYKSGNLIINEVTQIGEEDRLMEFSPTFLNFIALIKEVSKSLNKDG